LTNDDFVRTTEVRHKTVVQAIFPNYTPEGHFYREIYHGFYSTKEETFLTDKTVARMGNLILPTAKSSNSKKKTIISG